MFKCRRDNKPQNCVQKHKSIKVRQNAANRDKHINEASKQIFASNLFKMSYNTPKVCFQIGRFVSMSSLYELMTICPVIFEN